MDAADHLLLVAGDPVGEQQQRAVGARRAELGRSPSRRPRPASRRRAGVAAAERAVRTSNPSPPSAVTTTPPSPAPSVGDLAGRRAADQRRVADRGRGPRGRAPRGRASRSRRRSPAWRRGRRGRRRRRCGRRARSQSPRAAWPDRRPSVVLGSAARPRSTGERHQTRLGPRGSHATAYRRLGSRALAVPAAPRSGGQSRARRTSSRTPNPLAPLPTYSRPVSQAVPAMSRCAQGTLVDELLEERAGVDRPRLALRRGVGEVGDRALGQLACTRGAAAAARRARRSRSAARSTAAAHSSSLEISAA